VGLAQAASSWTAFERVRLTASSCFQADRRETDYSFSENERQFRSRMMKTSLSVPSLKRLIATERIGRLQVGLFLAQVAKVITS
jgi:hypothetical protein